MPQSIQHSENCRRTKTRGSKNRFRQVTSWRRRDHWRTPEFLQASLEILNRQVRRPGHPLPDKDRQHKIPSKDLRAPHLLVPWRVFVREIIAGGWPKPFDRTGQCQQSVDRGEDKENPSKAVRVPPWITREIERFEASKAFIISIKHVDPNSQKRDKSQHLVRAHVRDRIRR